jgi:hypothetical protein
MNGPVNSKVPTSFGHATPQEVDRKVERLADSQTGAWLGTTRQAAVEAVLDTTMDWRRALVEAWAQAASLLDELRELGRYAEPSTKEDREADCLRLALALMRARRVGFEDGMAIPAWSRGAVDPRRLRSSKARTSASEDGSKAP